MEKQSKRNHESTIIFSLSKKFIKDAAQKFSAFLGVSAFREIHAAERRKLFVGAYLDRNFCLLTNY